MYQMPSPQLAMRMQQLIATLNITPADKKDTITFLKMDAASIMTSLERESMAPTFTVSRGKRLKYRIGQNTLKVLRHGDKLLYGLEHGEFIIVDSIASDSDKKKVVVEGTNGKKLVCELAEEVY